MRIGTAFHRSSSTGIVMTDAILVLNAGSSSLKFAVYRDTGTPEMHLRGKIAGIGTNPNFSAKDASGAPLSSYAGIWVMS
jgi:acetate kinase